MRLSPEATVTDVEEALRLFKVSTLAAGESNPALFGAAAGNEDIRRAEDFLKRRLDIRSTLSSKVLLEEAEGQGFTTDTFLRAIVNIYLESDNSLYLTVCSQQPSMS